MFWLRSVSLQVRTHSSESTCPKKLSGLPDPLTSTPPIDVPDQGSEAVLGVQAPSKKRKNVAWWWQSICRGLPVSTRSRIQRREVTNSRSKGFSSAFLNPAIPTTCKACFANLSNNWASANSRRDRSDCASEGDMLSAVRTGLILVTSSSSLLAVFPTVKKPMGTSVKSNSTPKAWKDVEKSASLAGSVDRVHPKQEKSMRTIRSVCCSVPALHIQTKSS